MSTQFPEFASGFMDMKSTNNLTIDFNSSRGYFWRIGSDAQANFLPHLEIEIPNVSSVMDAQFKAMFYPNAELMGIPVGPALTDVTNKVRLYKASIVPQTFTTSQFLSFCDNIIVTGTTTVNDPITLESINLPVLIKPGTLTMDNIFDGIDLISSKTNGSIQGSGYVNGVRNANRNGDESILGSINYQTGEIQLLRSNTPNDNLMPQFVAYVAGTGPKPTENLVEVSINLNFNIFSNPVTVVWEFELQSEA